MAFIRPIGTFVTPADLQCNEVISDVKWNPIPGDLEWLHTGGRLAGDYRGRRNIGFVLPWFGHFGNNFRNFQTSSAAVPFRVPYGYNRFSFRIQFHLATYNQNFLPGVLISTSLSIEIFRDSAGHRQRLALLEIGTAYPANTTITRQFVGRILPPLHSNPQIRDTLYIRASMLKSGGAINGGLVTGLGKTHFHGIQDMQIRLYKDCGKP